MPVAQPAQLDRIPRSVRFAMKDGARLVMVLVANTALEDVEIWPLEEDDYLGRFKQNRKSFEKIASAKYDKGHIEADGTVCIRAMDLPIVSMN
jgi:hypothetical protein